MAAGQQADQHPLDQAILTYDHPLDLEGRPLDELRVPGWGGYSAGMGRPAGRWQVGPAVGLTHGLLLATDPTGHQSDSGADRLQQIHRVQPDPTAAPVWRL